MPTYEYDCSRCGNKFDLFQNITAKPIKKCPKCQKNTLRRLIGAGGGIIFKGSGFYATDYRKPSKDTGKSSNACNAADTKPECSSCPAKRNV